MTPAFFVLHSGLEREGPGSREDLDWAADLAGIGPRARILDAGCGPGADIGGLLAHAPEGHVHAVDLHAGFVAQAKALWGHESRAIIETADMASVAGPFDFIWVAGALYFLGITEGLRRFTAKLRPAGAIAFSELVWLTESPDAALRRALLSEYPEIGGLDTLRMRIEAAGNKLIGQRVLPDLSWNAYYDPLEARITMLRGTSDTALLAVLDEADAEIALWRRYRRQFGYALSVVR